MREMYTKLSLLGVVLCLCALTFTGRAQSPGLIIQPPTNTRSAVLDPNQDGYTSATTSGFSSSDVGAGNSEIPYKTVPPFVVEPTSDLLRGPNTRFTDLVRSADGTESGFYIYNDGTNILFRLRLGSIVSGAKGYSILLDTDLKFGGSGPYADPNYRPATTGINGNPGFELEIVLETGFQVAVYNVDGQDAATNPVRTYPLNSSHIVSIARSTVSGDNDYLYDFYVPIADLAPYGVTASTPLRLAATTVMAPKGAVGGPKSDTYGFNDALYNNYMRSWETVVNAQPAFRFSDVTNAGAGIQATCTAAPTLNAPIGAGTVNISGRWTAADPTSVPQTAVITLYKNGVAWPTTATISSGGTWTISNVTAAANDVFYAKAQASGESSCLQSNSVRVVGCTNLTSSTGFAVTCATVRGISGTRPAGTSVRIYSQTSTGTTLYASDAAASPTGFLVTYPTATTWEYQGANTQNNDPCGGGSPDIPAGSYAYTVQAPGQCESDFIRSCIGLTQTADPTITQATFYSGTNTVSGTAAANSFIRLYSNGQLYGTTTAGAGGAYTFANVVMNAGDVLGVSAQSSGLCASNRVTRSVTCFTTQPTITTNASGSLVAGANSISGTSTEPAGTIIRVYNSSNTQVGSNAVVGANGQWTVTTTVVAGQTYYATAQNGTCSVSAASGTATVLSAPSTVCASVTGTYAETTGPVTVTGTFSAPFTGTVRLLQDSDTIGAATVSGATTWSITVNNNTAAAGYNILYAGGVLTAATQATGAAVSAPCGSSVTVGCRPIGTAFTVSPGGSSTLAAPYYIGAATQTITVTGAETGVLYILEDAATGADLAKPLYPSGGVVTFSNVTMPTTAGIYNWRVRATRFSDNCTDVSKNIYYQITNAGPDAVPDAVDQDDDEDGIPDTVESGGLDATGDADNDGIPNYRDAQFCTLNAAGVCASLDKDGDGIINQFDLDSDNDGIPDIVEAGGVDTNGDGRADYSGTFAANDSDNDGLINRYDPTTGGTAIANLDTDGDGIANYLDLDSDNDGIADVAEVGGVDANGDGRLDNFNDTDRDGLDDTVDGDVGNDGTAENTAKALLLTGADANNDGRPDTYPQGINNTDGAGLPNPYDLDSDGDGLSDITEAGGTDNNNDGKVDTFTDSDGDGFANAYDGDANNDGTAENTANTLLSTGPDANDDGKADAYTKANADGAGLPNPYDLDSDNDGVPDLIEQGGADNDGDGRVDGSSDADGNGWQNAYDPTQGGINLKTLDANGAATGGSVFDFDGDGVANYLDLDSDGDGIPDLIEQGGVDSNNDGKVDATADVDNDGFADSVDPVNNSTSAALGTALITASGPLSNSLPTVYSAGDNLDGTGLVNMLDLDADGDGILDVREAGLADSDNNGIADGTTGADGWSDTVDALASLNLPNTDAKGGANYLDIDSDDDGIPDIIEGQTTVGYVAPSGADSDADGIDDAYDNNDAAYAGGANNGIAPVNTGNVDEPDYIDTDSDNDGVPDRIEGWDTNGNNSIGAGEIAYVGTTDTDGDGLLDEYDVNDAATNPTNNTTPSSYPNVDNPSTPERDWREDLDTDNDGVPDTVDADDDNDGIPDTVESYGVDPLGDADNDGIPNYRDTTPIAGVPAFTDSNGDGINDAFDADRNGIINAFDLDSDNDGIPDLVEAGGVDTNGDGRVDGPFTDTNGNGVADKYDPSAGGTAIANLDTDKDGIPNAYDLDSDNDGLPDVLEAGGTDTDNDGEFDPATDTDSDGLADAVDGDVGNDGVAENFANVLIYTGPDNNGDGRPDTYPKANADAGDLPNPYDLDSDNDGVPDLIEQGGVDSNGDGRIDVISDPDGDGWQNSYDPTQGGINLKTLDANGAGAGGGVYDFDGDGVPNYFDLDSDGDGIPDIIEQGGVDSNNDGKVDVTTDVDNDGFADIVDPLNNSTSAALGTPIITASGPLSNSLPTVYSAGDNLDGKGLVNMLDLDADDDGILDVREAGLADSDTNGIADGTPGADGWSDTVDALPSLILPNQDAFGRPNYLDIDSDDDGIPDIIEGQTTLGYVAPSGADSDADGIDDAYDNNDAAYAGGASNGITPVNTDGVDNPDYTDIGSDNDGINDRVEGWDFNGNNIIDGSEIAYVGTTDTDGDGLLDEYDTNNAAINPTNGRTPLFHPNTDNPFTPERDWREDVDNDNDGIPDAVDADDDNDGIPDTVESYGVDPLGDYDNDGIRNTFDRDPIPGVPLFVDRNGDNINDAFDADLNGIINAFDLDSDNDGIPDIVEAGGVDTNGDGRVDYAGTFASNDSDNDGLINIYDASTGGTAIANLDTDGDGITNAYDLDSDNDGIADVAEVGGVDANGDGRLDNVTDVDSDGLADVVDGDVGNDGTAENTANALIVTGTDGNSDGRPDTYPQGRANTDGGGLPNPYDLDSDNDGLADITEAGGTDNNNDGKVDTFIDTDRDGLADAIDGDAGNDGTAENTANALLPTGADANNDGKADAYTKANADGDSRPNPYDLDSDNDGVPDLVESGGRDSNGNGMIDVLADADGNGWQNAYDPTQGGINLKTLDANGAATGGSVFDFDGDGVANYLDLDSDNDGIPDIIEQGGVDSDNDGKLDATADVDNDGFIDSVDPLNNNTSAALGTAIITTGSTLGTNNLPTTYSTGDNFDGKGLINMLDLDADDDGILDVREAGLADATNDGIADGTTGADGWSDTVDALGSLTLPNRDAFGGANYLDIDSDNDGIPDVIEGQLTLAYVAPTGTDSDADGIDDAYDNNDAAYAGNASNGITPVNTDGTDNPDYTDLGSDNDGVSDRIEGWDTNGNNIIDGAEIAYVGTTDSDGDGLLDEYDADDAAINPTNGATPLSYPNVNTPSTPERDWREIGDTDNDGIDDITDLDDDNDGIPDKAESSGVDPLDDADGDGIRNYMDTSPGSGLPAFTDTNGDGVNDAYDNDKDGLINSWDLDSDNDGIADLVEAGGVDTNGDGRVDYTGAFASSDSDNDGLINTYDASTGGTTLGSLDTDSDGVVNIYDLDSDNDGIPDVAEVGGVDANGDGRLDNYGDTDGDGLDDTVDGDVGNDGTAENTGKVLLLTGTDGNGDGRPDTYPQGTGNTDGDNLPNPYDLDSDNDGLADITEAGGTDNNHTGKVDAFDDADGDGLADAIDGDVGNDGTAENTANTLLSTGADANNDGKADSYTKANADGDSRPNPYDLDSDNDAVPDLVELGGVDNDGDGRVDALSDADGNGWQNSYDPSQGGINLKTLDANGGSTGGGVFDFDGDGVANYLDLDSDNDGIPDIIEQGGVDSDNDGKLDASADADNDGFIDSVDPLNNNTSAALGTAIITTGSTLGTNNLPTTYSAGDNFDGKGLINMLDLDADDDGILDVREAGLADAANDGIADGTTGADGWSNTVDALGSLGLPNTDASGSADFLDIDADDDGITDNVEGQGTFSYVPPSGVDSDADGIDDQYDNNNASFAGLASNGITPVNTDGADNPDYTDTDTDNDGQADLVEGNDFNRNAVADDVVSLTGQDTDGDGLDDRFESVPAGGPTVTVYGFGGALGSSVSPAQQSNIASIDRDWRNAAFQLAATVLPVRFLSVKAVLAGRNALVSWMVADEQNVLHYEVERSTNGTSFTVAGTVPYDSARSAVKEYRFEDARFPGVRTWYRIRQVDIDGRYMYSAVVSLDPGAGLTTGLEVYPNPLQPGSVISITAATRQRAVLVLSDMNGRILSTRQVNLEKGKNAFPAGFAGSLANGTYVLRALVDGRPLEVKLVK
ncbi:hypothetical protein V9K67_12515 [Paraflavisolibacter sp. H34]|uniref:hypothetical protein n=1 Tax=Huijunlia imazamoxiresistens TaxID=3127457 RepID=UPI0030169A72